MAHFELDFAVAARKQATRAAARKRFVMPRSPIVFTLPEEIPDGMEVPDQWSHGIMDHFASCNFKWTPGSVFENRFEPAVYLLEICSDELTLAFRQAVNLESSVNRGKGIDGTSETAYRLLQFAGCNPANVGSSVCHGWFPFCLLVAAPKQKLFLALEILNPSSNADVLHVALSQRYTEQVELNSDTVLSSLERPVGVAGVLPGTFGCALAAASHLKVRAPGSRRTSPSP